MSERELNNLIADFTKYVDEKIKTETKEESRDALIRTGILDSSGNVSAQYRGLFT